MKNIVVIGSLNQDVIVEVERVPIAGETVHARGVTSGSGGKGANQALACARLSLGSSVAMVGLVGDDAHGQALRAALERDGVDVTRVGVRTGPSGCAFVFVEPDGHNRIVVVAGANSLLAVGDVDAVAACFDAQPLLLLQLESPLPTVVRAAEVAHARGCTVVLNPSPVIAVPQALWRAVDVVVLNEVEAREATGIAVDNPTQARDAARELLAKGPHLAVVTLGEAGAVAVGALRRGGAIEEHHLLARRVHAVDTTAAGDTFTGALCTALAADQPLVAALQRGIDAAAICVTRRGAMASVPYAAELGA